ncbi:hypothetical protein [Brevibacillus porteri]|uniref:hypothetical protein n=1 Tax=Brevibacillus porteri TaxID=2126350 RepID=UPI003641457C
MPNNLQVIDKTIIFTQRDERCIDQRPSRQSWNDYFELDRRTENPVSPVAIHIHTMDGINQVMEALSSSGKDQVVIIDDLLSHDHVINQVSDATDTLHGDQYLADIHFPFATLLFFWKARSRTADGWENGSKKFTS